MRKIILWIAEHREHQLTEAVIAIEPETRHSRISTGIISLEISNSFYRHSTV